MYLEMVNQDHFQGEFVLTVESVNLHIVEKSENHL